MSILIYRPVGLLLSKSILSARLSFCIRLVLACAVEPPIVLIWSWASLAIKSSLYKGFLWWHNNNIFEGMASLVGVKNDPSNSVKIKEGRWEDDLIMTKWWLKCLPFIDLIKVGRSFQHLILGPSWYRLFQIPKQGSSVHYAVWNF